MQTETIDSSQAAQNDSNGDLPLRLHLYREPEAFPISAGETEGRLPASFIHAFAAATGWELGVSAGEIKIVDMSEGWPARTPTAHRGKCDLIAKELSKLL